MILKINNILNKIYRQNSSVFGGYGWGDFYKKWSGCDISYPYLNAFSLNKRFEKGLSIVDVTVSVSDIIRENESNILEVENSTFAILRDLLNLLNSELKKHDMLISGNTNLTFFTNRGGDNVAGHYAVISISQFDGLDTCNNILTLCNE